MSADSPVVIGMTTELLDAPWYEGRRRYQLFTDYADCLRAEGAVVFLIPGDTPPTDLPPLLARMDGLLLCGGDDFDLSLLGGPEPLPECKPIPPEQQNLNLALVRAAMNEDLPLLGICLGMQAMSLAHHSELIQHIEDGDAHIKGQEHPVSAVPSTKIADLLGTDAIDVRSFHHQAIGKAGDGLVASAWSADGILEAIERPDLAFALGVQWHPERWPDSDASRALFSGFVQAARDYQGKLA